MRAIDEIEVQSQETQVKYWSVLLSQVHRSELDHQLLCNCSTMKNPVVLLALALLPNVAVNAFLQVSTVSKSRQIDGGFSAKSSLVEDSTQAESRAKLSELPPVLQDIVDERNEFRLNLGHAMDVLKQDYPEILRRTPGKHNVLPAYRVCGIFNLQHGFSFQISAFTMTRSL